MLIRGEPGHEFIDELKPLDREIVIDKNGYSAFVRTSCDKQLSKLGITHLIITGITTECCISSTLRVAVDLGYFCLLVDDCCAGLTQDLHNNVINWIEFEQNSYGWLAKKDDVVNALTK